MTVIGEIKYTIKDTEKVAEIRRIFGKDADAILQKYGTLAYDFMYENAKHNFKKFSYTSPEQLRQQARNYLLKQTTRPEDVVLYTAQEQNWDWKVRTSQVQEARKAAQKVVAAEKSAKPKAAAPASKVNWTAAQQASLKKWQGQAQLSDADYKKLEAKYGADLYKIMQNVVLQPSAVMSALGGQYKNSADTAQYLLSNTLSADQVKKVTSLQHSQPQRTAASQAQSPASTSAYDGGTLAEVTVTGRGNANAQYVGLGKVTPATFGMQAPSMTVNLPKKTNEEQKAELEKSKKALQKRKKQIQKEQAKLQAKRGNGTATQDDLKRMVELGQELVQVNGKLEEVEHGIKEISKTIKEAKKAEKEAQKQAKKAEKEAQKQAKKAEKEAKKAAKKKAQEEAKTAEATGEKKGNIFTRTRDTVKGWFSKKETTENTEATNTEATATVTNSAENAAVQTGTEVPVEQTDKDDTADTLRVQDLLGGEDVQLTKEQIEQNAKMVAAIAAKDQSLTPESNTQGQGQKTLTGVNLNGKGNSL